MDSSCKGYLYYMLQTCKKQMLQILQKYDPVSCNVKKTYVLPFYEWKKKTQTLENQSNLILLQITFEKRKTKKIGVREARTLDNRITRNSYETYALANCATTPFCLTHSKLNYLI